MNILKKLEQELKADWHHLQNETIPALKATLLRAYYLKFAFYRKTREWQLAQ